MTRVKSGLAPVNAPGLGIRKPPPLHCLLAFEAAARNLSLAKAAGELGLTHSAVAQSIALLEDRLAVKLVRSLIPVVELTRAGQQYFQSVQVFAYRMRDGLYERFPVGRTQLRITASQALSRLWLAPRLAAFTRRHPRIDLILTSTEQFQAVIGGGVDIGLRYGGVADTRQVAVPLWTDHLVAAGAPHLLAHADGMSPAGLAQAFPLIDHPAASWSLWLGAVDASLASATPFLMCSDLHLAIDAACQGLGLVIAPARVLEQKLTTGVLERASRHSVPAKPYQAVVSHDQFGRAPVQAFLTWLSDEVASQERSR